MTPKLRNPKKVSEIKNAIMALSHSDMNVNAGIPIGGENQIRNTRKPGFKGKGDIDAELELGRCAVVS